MRYQEYVPSEDEIQGWIEEICARGHRSPGTPNDLWLEKYGKEKFEALGLQVSLQPCPPFDSWIPGPSFLEVITGGEKLSLEVCPMVHVRSPQKIAAPLIYYKSAADLRETAGKIVVVDYPLGELTGFNYLLGADFIYDPDKNIADSVGVNPMPDLSRSAATVAQIAKTRPVAIVAVLTNYFESPFIYGVAGRANTDLSQIGGAWMSPATGRKLASLKGISEATLDLKTESQSGVVTNNIVGFLPGADDSIIFVDSHRDAPFMGATEDTAGIACVLAQAKYWSQVPKNERPHSFVFVWSSAHLKGAVGARTFVKDNPDLIKRGLLAVTIETPAREFTVVDNQLVDMKRPQPSWLQTSHVPKIQEALISAVKTEDYRRSMVVPTDIRQGRFTGEGYHYYDAGLPTIGHISSPVYYMDRADTPDKTNKKGQWQLTRALIRTIWATAGETIESMRSPDQAWRNRGGPPTSDRTRAILVGFDRDNDGELRGSEREEARKYIIENVYK